MSMTLAAEPIDGILESGLEPLLQAHWSEVAHDKDKIKLNVDWAEYRAHQKAGRFLPLALRKSGKLVGYNAFIIGRSLHYRDHIFATNDVIYLRPEERGVDGLWMIDESEKILRALGVFKVFYHVKTDAILGTGSKDSLESIEDILELEERIGRELKLVEALSDNTLGACLQVLGYSHVENNFGKVLTGD